MIARPIAGAIAQPIAKRIANASHVYVYSSYLTLVCSSWMKLIIHRHVSYRRAMRHPQPTTSRATLQAADDE